jgi:hypothetical protein
MSNIAYAIAGLYMGLQGDHAGAIGMVGLSIGSYIGHKYGEWGFDWGAMCFAFALIAIGNPPTLFAFLALIFVGASSFVAGYIAPERYQIPVLLTYVLLAFAMSEKNLMPALLLFAIAVIIRYTIGNDGHRHYDIGHSMWHIITAIAMTQI